MNKIIFTLLLLTSCYSYSQVTNPEEDQINPELKEELERIYLMDQGIREITDGNPSGERKAELLRKMDLDEKDIEGNKLYSLMREIDSINLIKVERIIQEYGYPGKSLVGEPANKAVFLVIQHSDKIDRYLPLVRKAAKEGELSKTYLAMMEDRNLMFQGLEQIYGTQIKGQANKEGEWIFFLWPVKDPEKVNILRKNMGIKSTVEEYLKRMDMEVKFYTLDEIDDL
ncbi:DUF6624 domain-containing protein [Salinimicrobium sediminilitoris]|uniref:DUF6624 domain-containing protein n=1 Tax=Salinimicrobium sediminilitoris TaxID=2876715 RepID=UPI001E42075E|nr:DUF6624 domain-containing protein [Salinimicrobium sediminilitoris]MCC8360180.1 hypothetical protein [Salinimicrobium sediminilitoris]